MSEAARLSKNQKARDQYRADAAVRRDSYARSLLRRYGLSIADVDRMKAEQGGVCFVCALPFVTTPHVDHQHDPALGFHGAKGDWRWHAWTTPEQKRQTIRCLLCARCNSALGRLGDTTSALRRLADRLDNWLSHRRAA